LFLLNLPFIIKHIGWIIGGIIDNWPLAVVLVLVVLISFILRTSC
jgi:hypothetical protein